MQMFTSWHVVNHTMVPNTPKDAHQNASITPNVSAKSMARDPGYGQQLCLTYSFQEVRVEALSCYYGPYVVARHTGPEKLDVPYGSDK